MNRDRSIVVHACDRLAGTGIASSLQELPDVTVRVLTDESILSQTLGIDDVDLIVVYFDSLAEDDRDPATLRGRMRRAGAPPVLAVLSGGLSEVLRALQMGVRGLVTTNDDPSVLVDTARSLLEGECSLAPAIATHLVQVLNRSGRQLQPADQAVFEVLTSREKEITQMLAMGMSTEEIANRIYVTRATVKTHISNILSKFNVSERSQVVAMAYNTGWLDNRLYSPRNDRG